MARGGAPPELLLGADLRRASFLQGVRAAVTYVVTIIVTIIVTIVVTIALPT
jgi:hypothetical protein